MWRRQKRKENVPGTEANETETPDLVETMVETKDTWDEGEFGNLHGTQAGKADANSTSVQAGRAFEEVRSTPELDYGVQARRLSSTGEHLGDMVQKR